jgi:flagellar biosynthesis GTPase FlhF
MNATETKTYRGRSLAEVLPKIKAELGPDAEIVRQRSGLTGGVGGFFQREMIEVDARAPEARERQPRFDAYDEDPADSGFRIQDSAPQTFVPDPLPAADPETEEGLSAPAIQEILRQAAPFADHLASASQQIEPKPQPSSFSPLPSPGRDRPQTADALQEGLVEAGLNAELAKRVVSETVSHMLPFGSPRGLKKMVRRSLARHIPVAPSAPAGARSIAFVGPGGSGKTLCAARLAAAYAAGSDMPVVVIALRAPDGGAELRSLLEPLGVGVRAVESGSEGRAHLAGAVDHAVVVVDTPAVAPGSAAEVAALGSELVALGVGEVHLTLPASWSGPAARDIGERLEPLHPSRIALTHLDESAHVGGLLDYAIRAERPISYVSQGTGVPGGLAPADAEELTALVLP